MMTATSAKTKNKKVFDMSVVAIVIVAMIEQ